MKILEKQKFFGYLSQRTSIFEGTIKDNIVFEKHDLDENKLKNVLEVSLVNEFLDTLSCNIDSNINSLGYSISGGQMQRVALARVLYSNPSILIMDEALGQMNIDLQIAIIKSLKKQKEIKNIINISHNSIDPNLFDREINLD